jgi:hypothetical protein
LGSAKLGVLKNIEFMHHLSSVSFFLGIIFCLIFAIAKIIVGENYKKDEILVSYLLALAYENQE